MGKSSGGNRGASSKIVGFAESEKAIQLEVRYSGEVAPKGGVCFQPSSGCKWNN